MTADKRTLRLGITEIRDQANRCLRLLDAGEGERLPRIVDEMETEVLEVIADLEGHGPEEDGEEVR